jgi:hypothetical protein
MIILEKFYRMFPRREIPLKERAGYEHVLHLMQSLESILLAFESAVDLTLYAESKIMEIENQGGKAATPWERGRENIRKLKQKQRYGGWKRIAARDGAMNIHHFEVTLTAIDNAVKRYPTLRTKAVDMKKLEEAKKDFSDTFPDAKLTRDAIGHSASAIETVEKMSEQLVDGVYVSNRLEPNQIWGMTFKKEGSGGPAKMLKVAINSANSATLHKIVELQPQLSKQIRLTMESRDQIG